MIAVTENTLLDRNSVISLETDTLAVNVLLIEITSWFTSIHGRIVDLIDVTEPTSSLYVVIAEFADTSIDSYTVLFVDSTP